MITATIIRHGIYSGIREVAHTLTHESSYGAQVAAALWIKANRWGGDSSYPGQITR